MVQPTDKHQAFIRKLTDFQQETIHKTLRSVRRECKKQGTEKNERQKISLLRRYDRFAVKGHSKAGHLYASSAGVPSTRLPQSSPDCSNLISPSVYCHAIFGLIYSH